MDRARRLKTIGASLGIGAGMCLVLCGVGGLFAVAFGMRSSTSTGFMERVLDADVVAGASSTDAAVVIVAMKQIDLAGCPQEFQEAYVDHIAAWERSAQTRIDAQAWIDQHVPGQMTVDDMLHLGTVPPDLSPEAEAQRRALMLVQANGQQAIQTSYDDVLRIAQKYGARTPVQPSSP